MAVGDATVGKASTFVAYSSEQHPKAKFGFRRDLTSANILFRGEAINMTLWDVSGGGESYGRLRPVSYPGTDVFLML